MLIETPARRSRRGGEDETALLLATLKRCFKEHGLTYKDVALALSISEASVKRYFAGGTITLAQLQRLCAIIRIGIADLVELSAAGNDQSYKPLSQQQEEGLARSALTSFVFYLIRHGWTAAEIRDELDMDEAEITAQLIRLEKLGLIDLLPANRVRFLTAKFPHWLPGGPIRRQFDRTLKSEFATLDYHAPGVGWELETVKLSRSSQAQLQEMMEDFAHSVRGLAEKDRKLPRDESTWRSILIISKPADPKQLRKKGRSPKRT